MRERWKSIEKNTVEDRTKKVDAHKGNYDEYNYHLTICDCHRFLHEPLITFSDYSKIKIHNSCSAD